MKKTKIFSNGLQPRYKQRQVVYMPGYEPIEIRKWLIALVILISLVTFTIVLRTITTRNKQNSSVQGQGSEIQNNEIVDQKLHKVVNIIDGDTIDVDINGATERIRIIGLDTPETVDPRKTVQCFGVEASNKAKELLQNKTVRLEVDVTQGERDKYNRLLRYVFLSDGTSYSKIMISDGYAHEYTYGVPYKYQSEYRQAQQEAENASRGLWSPTTCSGNTESPESSSVTAPNNNVNPIDIVDSNCDPNYDPCVPDVNYDLDCGDIGFSVIVIGTDTHRFDKDGDGYGCESY